MGHKRSLASRSLQADLTTVEAPVSLVETLLPESSSTILPLIWIGCGAAFSPRGPPMFRNAATRSAPPIKIKPGARASSHHGTSGNPDAATILVYPYPPS